MLHTKFIIADLKNVYIGSANMDWKALTEVAFLIAHFETSFHRSKSWEWSYGIVQQSRGISSAFFLSTGNWERKEQQFPLLGQSHTVLSTMPNIQWR